LAHTRLASNFAGVLKIAGGSSAFNVIGRWGLTLIHGIGHRSEPSGFNRPSKIADILRLGQDNFFAK
jgi:hypothetical protein